MDGTLEISRPHSRFLLDRTTQTLDTLLRLEPEVDAAIALSKGLSDETGKALLTASWYAELEREHGDRWVRVVKQQQRALKEERWLKTERIKVQRALRTGMRFLRGSEKALSEARGQHNTDKS